MFQLDYFQLQLTICIILIIIKIHSTWDLHVKWLACKGIIIMVIINPNPPMRPKLFQQHLMTDIILPNTFLIC